MSRKKKVLIGIGAVILLVLNLLILFHEEPMIGNYKLQMTVKSDTEQKIQVYYSREQNPSEEMSLTKEYKKWENGKRVFEIPSYSRWIRLDLGTKPAVYEISDFTVSCGDAVDDFDSMEIPQTSAYQQIAEIQKQGNTWGMTTEGDDAYLWFSLPQERLYPEIEKQSIRNTWIKNILALIFIDGAAVLAFVFRKKFFTLPVELYQNRGLILNLAKNDFKTKYAGSYLGIVWAFIQPIVTILVYWFVFSVGLKAGEASNYPFVLYLVSGIVPWFFFQDALNGGTNALLEYNYLVKKVVFKISILPIVKIISAFFVHMFFVAFSLILCTLYGYYPSLETIQILYYSACTFLFALGLVYATSAIVIFFRDLTQIINIFLQVGVWLTPIMWDVNMLAEYPWLVKLFKLNPMYYIVSGYRDSMLGNVWFWEHWGWTLYFWFVTVLLFGLGSVIFKRLKPHFADVL